MSTPKKVGRQNTGRLSTSKSRGYVMSLYSRRDLRPCHSLCSEVILCLFSDSCDTRSCTVSETLPISGYERRAPSDLELSFSSYTAWEKDVSPMTSVFC